ncbi:MAG: hypothetical protein M3Y28_04990 [Armatimonadota bacterium]|nr:hypothetical protein [Armatimonadota bacterium]
MTPGLTEEQETRVRAAVTLIGRTPGYGVVGAGLTAHLGAGKIGCDATLPDRAQAGLTGRIVLGPEAMSSPTLSLAQTLVHEWHHVHQFPLTKTISFWLGVLMGRPVMRRFEQPAYRAALDFLETVARAFPDLAEAASAERSAIEAVFEAEYGGPLD